jgi:hypothetical protein
MCLSTGYPIVLFLAVGSSAVATVTEDNGMVLVRAKDKMSPAYSVQQQRKTVKHNPIVAKAMKVVVHARIRGEYNKRQVELIIVHNKYYYIKGFARRPRKWQ